MLKSNIFQMPSTKNHICFYWDCISPAIYMTMYLNILNLYLSKHVHFLHYVWYDQHKCHQQAAYAKPFVDDTCIGHTAHNVEILNTKNKLISQLVYLWVMSLNKIIVLDYDCHTYLKEIIVVTFCTVWDVASCQSLQLLKFRPHYRIN